MLSRSLKWNRYKVLLTLVAGKKGPIKGYEATSKRRVCFSHIISHFEEEKILDKKENGSAGNTKGRFY